MCVLFFFFKQKTAYEMRISDWSSDVCSSDLLSLGIFVSCLSTITDGHGSPHWPGSPSDRKRRPIGDASAKRKQPDTFAPQPVGHEMRDSENVIQRPPPG